MIVTYRIEPSHGQCWLHGWGHSSRPINTAWGFPRVFKGYHEECAMQWWTCM